MAQEITVSKSRITAEIAHHESVTSVKDFGNQIKVETSGGIRSGSMMKWYKMGWICYGLSLFNDLWFTKV